MGLRNLFELLGLILDTFRPDTFAALDLGSPSTVRKKHVGTYFTMQ